MQTHILKYASIFAAALASAIAHADVYTTSDGQSYEGEVYKILEGTVFIKAGEEKVEVALDSFSDTSKADLQAWAEANPDSVDVYTKWDVQPRIKSSVMPSLPEQFLAEEFKGMVSVDLILNESGQVIHASVKKSTHTELETPSLEAAKTWLFEPAQVGGKPVKSKLRVPFKFTHTPQPVEEPTT